MLLNILDNGIPSHVSLLAIGCTVRNHAERVSCFDSLYNVVNNTSTLSPIYLKALCLLFCLFIQVLVIINYLFAVNHLYINTMVVQLKGEVYVCSYQFCLFWMIMMIATYSYYT